MMGRRGLASKLMFPLALGFICQQRQQGASQSWGWGLFFFKKILFPWALSSVFVDHQESTVHGEKCLSSRFPKTESRGLRAQGMSSQCRLQMQGPVGLRPLWQRQSSPLGNQ